MRSEAADAARISPQPSGLVARTTRINLRRCRQRPLGGLGYEDPTAGLQLLTATCFVTCDCAQLCSSPHSSVRPLVPTTQSPMSGQEHKDGQFYKTPRRQEPNSYAVTRNTWRHHGINQHHHAPTINQPIMEKLGVHGASWKSWTTMVRPQLTNPLRCTAPQEARIPLGRRARFEHFRAACY